jgi:hypothetical protein
MWETPYWVALTIWGGLVALGSLAVLGVVIFVPGNPHSGHAGKIFLFIIAGQGMAYGVSQIREAMREKHLASEKTRNDSRARRER